jgi:hypothetical protein
MWEVWTMGGEPYEHVIDILEYLKSAKRLTPPEHANDAMYVSAKVFP